MLVRSDTKSFQRAKLIYHNLGFQRPARIYALPSLAIKIIMSYWFWSFDYDGGPIFSYR